MTSPLAPTSLMETTDMSTERTTREQWACWFDATHLRDEDVAARVRSIIVDHLVPAPAGSSTISDAAQAEAIETLSRLLRGMARRLAQHRGYRRALIAEYDQMHYSLGEARHGWAKSEETIADLRRQAAAAPETSDPTPAEVASRLSAAAEVCEKAQHHGLAYELSQIASHLDEDGYSDEVCAAVARALSGEASTDAR